MSNWFETGTSGVEREKVEREKKRQIPWRFFLKVGQSTRIIFLDDFNKKRVVELPGSGEVVEQPTVPFCFHEHNLTVAGDWKNWFTCLGKIDPPCPICNEGHYKYYIGFYTVLAEWQDQDGVTHWSKRLFGAKIDAIERIRMKQTQYKKDGRVPDGQFQYGMFHVSRTGERSVVTGDDLEFIKKLSREEVEALLPKPQQGQEPLDADPYEYMKLFAPRPKDEITKILKSGDVQPPRNRKTNVDSKPNSFGGKATVSASSSDTGDGEQKSVADDIDF